MAREEVELIPEGLITCILNNKEVRILKISIDTITVRLAEEEDIKNIEICFYDFNKYKYEKVLIKEFNVEECKKEKFYYEYHISVKCSEFTCGVKRIFKDYTKYIMLKNYGDENEFSEEMTGYPKDKDEDFYKYYLEQKKEWMSYLSSKEDVNKKFELAIKIDNDILYKEYLNRKIESFKEYYYDINFIRNEGIFRNDIKRVYIGNEFCHNLFPDKNLLMEMILKAHKENLDVTLCFTYLRECYIEYSKGIINKVYEIAKEKNMKIEILINDWGMLDLLIRKEDYFTITLGVLLNKRKKDPRYNYKKGYAENKELMGENSLNSSDFREFLEKFHIHRYEYESCGYDIKIAAGNHSMGIPFYVTNTSQYCPLYAVCKNGERGKQQLVRSCKKYCKDYVFLYPKHLKMIGRYNSLFAFDDSLLRNNDKLSKYLDNGIDRIVLNFL